MGLGIYMHASGRTAPEQLRDELGETLARLAREALPPLEGYIGAYPSEEELLVRLHPADEEVHLSVDAGEVLLSARTNGGGPGYHAFLVRLMDGATAALGLRWRSGEDDQDETGYLETRDFAALQEEMAAWLRGVSGMVSGGEAGDGPWLLSLPLGTPTPAGDFAGALSPMGVFDHDWLQRTAAASGDELLARAAEYFPWWEEAAGPAATHNHGRALMQLLAWHPPATEEERLLMEAATACLDAGAVASPFPLELAELRALLRQSPDEARVPAPRRFGYRRGEVRQSPFEGVALTLPGYFYEETEEDGTHLYWFPGRNVRVASLRATPPPGRRGTLPSIVHKPDARVIEELDLALAPPMESHAVVTEASEDGERFLMVHVTVAVPGDEVRLAVVTVALTDPADLAWCKRMLATVHVSPIEQK